MTYQLWYTGYDGTREGIKLLGYATSPDGIALDAFAEEPAGRDHWVEDMMVVRNAAIRTTCSPKARTTITPRC